LTVPVLTSLRQEVITYLDRSFTELVLKDWEASDLLQRAQGDSDRALISYNLLQKLFFETSFKEHMESSLLYGRVDPRTWMYRFESHYYHPFIVNIIKRLRRVHRNEEAVAEFRRDLDRKAKKMSYASWRRYVALRNQCRRFVINAGIRWKGIQCGKYFDLWKRFTIQDCIVVIIQKRIRGHLGRARRDLLIRMGKRAVRIQSAGRMLRKRIQFNQIRARTHWSVLTIQRHVRGYQARRRVQYIIEALVDTGRRMLEKQKADWHRSRMERAATAIQMYIRRHLRRQRAVEAQNKVNMKLAIEEEMASKEMEAKVVKDVYKSNLVKWFHDRKEEYDLNRVHEHSTLLEKSKIIAYRRRQIEYERKEKEKRKQAMMDRADEEKIEGFIKKWEFITEERVKQRIAMCRRALALPETPEEKVLKADLNKRINAHVKVVLRRADKQKIPMEIPEAKELATVEIIEAEGKLERGRVKEEMIKQANDITAAEEARSKKEKDNEKKEKRRKRKWAAVVLQKYYRAYQAYKEARRVAYTRYKKHFNPELLAYFYENLRDKTTSWKKPAILGSYDIDCDDYWVVVKDKSGENYYYNPRTWAMQWVRRNINALMLSELLRMVMI